MITLDEMRIKCMQRAKTLGEQGAYLKAAFHIAMADHLVFLDDEQTIEVSDTRADKILLKAMHVASIQLKQHAEDMKMEDLLI